MAMRRHEFERMLAGDRPGAFLEWMRRGGEMRRFIPELEETCLTTQNRSHLNTVWEHTLDVVERVPRNRVVRMAALLHDIGKVKTKTVDDNGVAHFYGHELVSAGMSDAMLKRLGYSNDVRRRVVALVANHMRAKDWGNDCSRMKDRALRKMEYGLGEGFYDWLALVAADNVSCVPEYRMPDQVSNILRRVEELEREGMNMFDYVLPLGDKEVMGALGIDSPVETRKCLAWLMKFAFNNPKVTREELLCYVRQYKR